jgi:hypothetical protein
MFNVLRPDTAEMQISTSELLLLGRLHEQSIEPVGEQRVRKLMSGYKEGGDTELLCRHSLGLSGRLDVNLFRNLG